MPHPLVYVGLAAVGIGGLYEGVKWMQGRSAKESAQKKGSENPITKEVVTKDSTTEILTACTAGTTAAGTDAKADVAAGTGRNPRPSSGYSSTPAVQAQFMACYGTAYEPAFVSFSAASAKFSKDDTGKTPPPSPGDKTAEADGYAGGFAQGKADAANGDPFIIGDMTRVPAGYRGKPSNETLAAFWVGGYTKGYSEGFTAGSKTTSESSTTEDSVGASAFTDKQFAAILRDVHNGSMRSGRAHEVAAALESRGYRDHAAGIRKLALKVERQGMKSATQQRLPPWIAARVPTRKRAA